MAMPQDEASGKQAEDLIERVERSLGVLEELEEQAEEIIARARTAIKELSRIAIPGVIIWRMVSCGKERCLKCRSGIGHGPYAYLVFSSGKQKYIGRKVPWEITRGVNAWKALKTLKPQLSEAEKAYQKLKDRIGEVKTLLKSVRDSFWWLLTRCSLIVREAEVWLTASPKDQGVLQVGNLKS